ncbi:MAG: F0F1 ATP synthase subunit epsilon [Xanthomonadaceae bacterium]|jgi:F-type H+-transporting ATPase subunit epsilon|nr:F0F1 ATP synthase subunit epsilon [Xanthomonadaceae bacterium]MDE2247407.1 F0F1 ATP synthase subunit epsilon [Xanthomonadaceae bacterium]
MPAPLMQLEILLPFGVFARRSGVSRIVAETADGSFGLLPHRLDCVAALTPGLLLCASEAEGESWLAIDEGVLVKAGSRVSVSVRRALAGTDLTRLRQAVEQEFLVRDEREQDVRQVMARLEAGFLRRYARLST